MWKTKGFLKLLQLMDVQKIDLQACMYGAPRAKWTSFLTNIEEFKSLAVACDESHPHAPWQVHSTARGLSFDTAAEAEYPPAFCQSMAKIIFNLAVKAGLDPTAVHPLNKHRGNRDALGASAARQPRGT